MFHWPIRELGTGACFLAVNTVLMGKEMSILTDAWPSPVLFESGVNRD